MALKRVSASLSIILQFFDLNMSSIIVFATTHRDWILNFLSDNDKNSVLVPLYLWSSR